MVIYTKALLNTEGNRDRQSIEEYNLELDKALERVKNGEFTSLEELEREMEAW